MAGESEHVIEAEGIGRAFGRRRVLDRIDLRVSRGEIFGLVGPDGAGKTTLLQILSAILDPSEGSCRVLGFDSARQASAITSRIGYMAQGFTLYGRLSVAENIAFSARTRGIEGATLRQRRERLLAMAGLTPFLGRREDQLSGGMRKKLALCTNLIHEPPLVLLDEPGLGVDPLSRRELWDILRDFRERGSTIVFSTSYMDEAELCDRVAFLDAGRVVALGTPAELRSRVEGLVFNVRTARPADVQSACERHTPVIGTQWRADGVRFQLAPGTRLPDALSDEIRPLGAVEPAKPEIEDVFTILTSGNRDKEAREGAGGEAPAPPRAQLRDQGPPVVSRGLTRRFGSFIAVDDATIEVARGEILGLLGPNGAGKTTLIRMLCGLLPPSEGEARIAGFDIARAPGRVHQSIGYMSQRFSLYPDLTVGENLAFFAAAYGLGRGEARDAMHWAMARTGLGGLGDEIAQGLSGATRQRLALACSIMHRPSVLFLDEPTSGVDPLSRARFWRLINTLARDGTTVIVTTHYLEEAIYCHRLGLMYDGRFIASGPFEELRAGLGREVSNTVEAVFIAYVERARAQSNAVRNAAGSR